MIPAAMPPPASFAMVLSVLMVTAAPVTVSSRPWVLSVGLLLMSVTSLSFAWGTRPAVLRIDTGKMEVRVILTRTSVSLDSARSVTTNVSNSSVSGQTNVFPRV